MNRAELDALLDTHRLPYVHIAATKAASLPLWASKGNGRPYLPKGTKWPRDMYPAVQIDFADVPALPGFPREGMLSVWWTEDHESWKLFYFPTVERDEAKLETDFSFFDWNQILYPFHPNGEVALSFEQRMGCPSWGDVRFAEIVGQDWIDSLLEDDDAFRAMFEHVWAKSRGGDSRLGGYASPQQEDPRETPKYRRYETLLLQLQNDNFTHEWYIESAKLAEADFSDVLYHSACD